LALHPHGSALLSVHPKVPAGGDQSVIAACACSVEETTDGIGFAHAGDVGKENEPGIGAFVPARMERLGIIRGSAAAGLSRRSERVRSDAFRQIYSPRADRGAIQGINFALHQLAVNARNVKQHLNFLMSWRSRLLQNIVHCTCEFCFANVGA
jgi:hypothetical protein